MCEYDVLFMQCQELANSFFFVVLFNLLISYPSNLLDFTHQNYRQLFLLHTETKYNVVTHFILFCPSYFTTNNESELCKKKTDRFRPETLCELRKDLAHERE